MLMALTFTSLMILYNVNGINFSSLMLTLIILNYKQRIYMHGAKDILRLLKLGDHKWDVGNYNYAQLVSELSENDKKIVKALDNIGDGELSAIGIIIQHQDLVNNYPRELAKDFYESVMYGFCMITYEEMRHGFMLKELASQLNTGQSFIENVNGNLMHELIFETNELYKNPYESLMSFLLGEITNVELYASVESQVEHEGLKNIVKNIKKDEQTHKGAWLSIVKRMVQSNEIHREKFIAATKAIHFIHQAEVSDYFKNGALSVQKFFTTSVSKFILEEKHKILSDIFGESPLDKKQMLMEHLEYFNENFATKATS